MKQNKERKTSLVNAEVYAPKDSDLLLLDWAGILHERGGFRFVSIENKSNHKPRGEGGGQSGGVQRDSKKKVGLPPLPVAHV